MRKPKPKKPCGKCGGEKDRGGFGVKFCSRCSEESEWRKEGSEWGRRKGTSSNPNCHVCGGPKAPPGEAPKKGQKYCASCKEKRAEEAVDRHRERERARGRRRRAAMTPGQKQAYNEEARLRQQQRRRSGGAVARVYKPKPPKSPKQPKVVVPPEPKLVVPAEILRAWKRAGQGTQFKKLCPTLADLKKRYGVMQ